MTGIVEATCCHIEILQVILTLLRFLFLKFVPSPRNAAGLKCSLLKQEHWQKHFNGRESYKHTLAAPGVSGQLYSGILVVPIAIATPSLCDVMSATGGPADWLD